MLPPLEEVEQYPVERGGLGYEMDRLHQLGKPFVPAVFVRAQEDVLAQDDAHHVVGIGVIDRSPAVAIPLFLHFPGLGHGQVFAQGKGYRARGHHLADDLVTEFQNIGDHLFLFRVDHSGLTAEDRDGVDFLQRHRLSLVSFGDQAGHRLAEPDDRGEYPDHPLEGHGDPRGQLLGVGHPDGLGQDLGEEQDGQGENSGKEAEVMVAEHRDKGGPGHGRAHGVGNGVQGQNGGDRPMDVFFQFFENSARGLAGLVQHLDLGDGQRIEGGLKDAAQR